MLKLILIFILVVVIRPFKIFSLLAKVSNSQANLLQHPS